MVGVTGDQSVSLVAALERSGKVRAESDITTLIDIITHTRIALHSRRDPVPRLHDPAQGIPCGLLRPNSRPPMATSVHHAERHNLRTVRHGLHHCLSFPMRRSVLGRRLPASGELRDRQDHPECTKSDLGRPELSDRLDHGLLPSVCHFAAQTQRRCESLGPRSDRTWSTWQRRLYRPHSPGQGRRQHRLTRVHRGSRHGDYMLDRGARSRYIGIFTCGVTPAAQEVRGQCVH